MNINQTKALSVTILTPICAVFSGVGVLLVPFLLLVAANFIDYGTGLVASKYRGQKINSYKSFRGIAKKVCMWLLVAVGILLDVFIINYGDLFGIVLPSVFIVSCLVIAWLIVNETISILENMLDIGVEMPPFLMNFVKNIKSQVEKKAETEISTEKERE